MLFTISSAPDMNDHHRLDVVWYPLILQTVIDELFQSPENTQQLTLIGRLFMSPPDRRHHWTSHCPRLHPSLLSSLPLWAVTVDLDFAVWNVSSPYVQHLGE